MVKNKNIFLGLISFCIFVISSVYITYPLIFNLTNSVSGYGDELVICWIQNWIIHALFTNPLDLFNANIYYPYQNTLAFSDALITSSILAIPMKLITQEPISTFNFTLISSLVLFGFSIYLLCFYFTRNFLASIFCGIMVIFSPAVLDYSVHLQILSIEWVPLSILLFIHFINTNKSKFLFISMIFFLLQVYNSIMPAYFIVISIFVIVLFNMVKAKKIRLRIFTKFNFALILIFLGLGSLIAIPYYKVSSEFNYVRDLRDSVHFAFQPEDFLYPSDRTVLKNVLINTLKSNQISQNNEFKPGYLGLIFSFLTIVTLIYFIKHFKKHSLEFKSFMTISIVGFILSLGPVLHLFRQTIHKPFLIPLPYALFYYLLPGFAGFRNSARWNMLFIIGISIGISIFLNTFLRNKNKSLVALIYIFLFIGIVAELSVPMKLYTIDTHHNFPKTYQWLSNTQPDVHILELPIYNWDMMPLTQNELFRQYYGTIHFKKTINGYSGFSPPPWQTLVTNLNKEFPSKKNIEFLKSMSIDYIIIHKSEYDLLSSSDIFPKGTIYDGTGIINKIQGFSDLALEKQFGETYIFKIN